MVNYMLIFAMIVMNYGWGLSHGTIPTWIIILGMGIGNYLLVQITKYDDTLERRKDNDR